MENLLARIKNCSTCKAHLPLGPKPVLTAHLHSKIVIIGQAPGTKVHASGIPWDDASGRQLRKWMGVTDDQFYNTENFAIVPMGFCYPGRGKGGDMPPRPECAPQWHKSIFELMPQVELVILIGLYAQKYYLKKTAGKSLTETVANYQSYLPYYFPLPHPSPRNRFWLTKNPWFEQHIEPELRQRIHEIIV